MGLICICAAARNKTILNNISCSAVQQGLPWNIHLNKRLLDGSTAQATVQINPMPKETQQGIQIFLILLMLIFRLFHWACFCWVAISVRCKKKISSVFPWHFISSFLWYNFARANVLTYFWTFGEDNYLAIFTKSWVEPTLHPPDIKKEWAGFDQKRIRNLLKAGFWGWH